MRPKPSSHKRRARRRREVAMGATLNTAVVSALAPPGSADVLQQSQRLRLYHPVHLSERRGGVLAGSVLPAEPGQPRPVERGPPLPAPLLHPRPDDGSLVGGKEARDGRAAAHAAGDRSGGRARQVPGRTRHLHGVAGPLAQLRRGALLSRSARSRPDGEQLRRILVRRRVADRGRHARVAAHSQLDGRVHRGRAVLRGAGGGRAGRRRRRARDSGVRSMRSACSCTSTTSRRASSA